jgi:hypothetical protein
MALAITHRCDNLPIPVEVRPDVSPSLAAGLADEPRLEIGQPDVIRPSISADRDRMTALVIRAVDQDSAHASVAHPSEGDLLRAIGHGAISLSLGARRLGELLGPVGRR